MLDYENVLEQVQNNVFSDSLIDELLVVYRQDMEKAGIVQIEEQYQVGKERFSTVLCSEQKKAMKNLENLCRIEAKTALHIAFERGLYAGFQHFFQRDVEPLTFEHFVLDKLLTVPEMKQFPDYYEARMMVNEMETELADQLDPFSREHLTSITYAWEERSMAMLRYGFELGYQETVSVIGQIAPEDRAHMIEKAWQKEREANPV